MLTARAKGLDERRVLYGHVFRNAMLIVIAGFPAAFIGVLFTGSLLIEIIFSLDGLGLLGYEAVHSARLPDRVRAHSTSYTLLGLLLKIISDLTYILVDPRIDFEAPMSAVAVGAGPAAERSRSWASRCRCRRSDARRLANFKANRRGYVSLASVPRPVPASACSRS